MVGLSTGMSILGSADLTKVLVFPPLQSIAACKSKLKTTPTATKVAEEGNAAVPPILTIGLAPQHSLTYAHPLILLHIYTYLK